VLPDQLNYDLPFNGFTFTACNENNKLSSSDRRSPVRFNRAGQGLRIDASARR
jgi:hypothetical protein